MTQTLLNTAGGKPADDVALLREALRDIGRAWWQTRILRRSDVAALLPGAAAGAVPACAPEDLWRRVDRIVRRTIFWKGDKYCFYRSFAVAAMLRRRGVPARLDFGLRLSGGRRRQCHCWVSVGGRPLCEAADPNRNFPVDVGGRGSDVRYWLADEDSGH